MKTENIHPLLAQAKLTTHIAPYFEVMAKANREAEEDRIPSMHVGAFGRLGNDDDGGPSGAPSGLWIGAIAAQPVPPTGRAYTIAC